MRSFIKPIFVLMICITVAGCATGSQQSKWSGLVHPDVLAKAGLKYYWDVEVDLDAGEQIVKLYSMDENLYCLTDKNTLITVDAAAGIVRWRVVVAHSDKPVYRPMHYNGLTMTKEVTTIEGVLSPGRKPAPITFDAVIVNTITHALVLDRRTGRQYRKMLLKPIADCGGTCDGRYFLYGTARGTVQAHLIEEDQPSWHVATEDLVKAPIEFFGGYFYVAGQDNIFYIFRPGVRPKREWRQQMSGPVVTQFHVDDRGCFVPCEDNRIYAYDRLDLAELWEPFVCEGPLRTPVQVGQITLFQYAEGDKFYAINLSDGTLRWSLPAKHKVVGMVNNDVYLVDDRGNLRVMDQVMGPESTKTSVPMTGMELFASNITAPAVYTATRDGKLFCIRSITDGHLTPEMLNARK